MKHFILLMLIFCIFGCGKKKAEKVVLFEEIFTEEYEIQDSLFLIESLRDTLYAYMDYIDTIPNPPGYPIVYRMEFYKSKSDTIVLYTSSSGPIEFINAQPSFKGGTRIKDRSLIIYLWGLNKLSDILNEHSLSPDYPNYLDSIICRYHDGDFMMVYRAPQWEYKYSNGNLILIKKDDKDMDRIREKLGRQTSLK